MRSVLTTILLKFLSRALLLITTNGTPSLKRPSSWSAAFRDYIERSCEVDASKRSSCEELLQHEFIRGACSEAEFAEFATKRFS